MTIPITHIQIKEHLDLSTGMTHFTCGCPSVNFDDRFITFLCLPFHFLHEISKCIVRYFSAPEAFHAFKVQVFKETGIKLSDKFKCEFPVMVFALPLYFSIYTRQVFTCTFAIVAAFLFPRQRATSPFDQFRSSFIELWRLIFRAIRTGKEILETKVKPCCLTSLGCRLKSLCICRDSDILLPHCVFLNGNPFDVAFNRSAIPKLIPTPIDTDFRNRTSVSLVNSLYLDLATIKGHGFVFIPTPKFRRTLGSPFKEVLPAFINALDTLLQTPRIGYLPMVVFVKSFQFRQMFFHIIERRSLVVLTMPIYPIMPLPQRNKMIVDMGNGGQVPLQMAISFVSLYLVFVGAHYIYPSHYNTTFKWCGGTLKREVNSTAVMRNIQYHKYTKKSNPFD